MLAASARWGGGESERPFLPRAFSVLQGAAGGANPAAGVELQFLVEDVGPGTKRLCELAAGDGLLLVGPLGDRALRHHARGAAHCSSAAESGSRRWRSGRTGSAPGHARCCSGSATPHTPPARRLLTGARVATDDGSVGHHGLVTELLGPELERAAQRGRGVRVRAAGDARGGTLLCAEHGAPAQLALESGMACGFGACFGCVVPTRHGYVRLCVEGPVLDAAVARGDRAGAPVSVSFCGLELEHPIINGSGTFDAIAARRAFGDELLERFPFAAFVTKTVTVAAARGEPAAAAVGAAQRG